MAGVRRHARQHAIVLAKGVQMARPLTKTKKDGTVYRRPTEVEAEIYQALSLTAPALRARLQITDRDRPGYLSSECLVHLLRQEFRRHGSAGRNEERMQELLQTLLARCEAILVVKVPDSSLPRAADVRQDILDKLVDRFFDDGSGDQPDALDIYECKFNRAFRSLYIDAVRPAQRRRAKEISLAELAQPAGACAADADEDVFDRISALSAHPTQEGDAFLAAVFEAIGELPADERTAFVLVCVMGYKEESDDPGEVTAATRCKCTGRTIRNRLKRAAQRLAPILSE